MAEPGHRDRDADITEILEQLRECEGDWPLKLGWNLAKRCREARARAEAAERECTAQYVKGWNDGEADAEAQRLRADAAEGRERALVEGFVYLIEDLWLQTDDRAKMRISTRLHEKAVTYRALASGAQEPGEET